MDEIIEGMQFYTIKCQHCGQEALLTPLNWKTIDYGLILLTGEEDDGYVGITCPNPECLHTTLKKESMETIQRLREALFEKAEHGPGYTKPMLRYRSFPYGFAFPSELVQYRLDFQIDEISDTHQSMGEEEVYYRLAENNRKDFRGLYLPYGFGDLAMGPAIFVPLFLKEGIEEILKYENDKKTKVFPRYEIYDKVIEDTDRFCYFHLTRDLAIEELRNEIPDLRLSGEDGSSTPSKEAHRTHAFLQALTTPAGQTRKYHEMLRSAMEDQEEEIGPEDTMEHQVVEYFNKGLGKDFLQKSYLTFIQEYTEITEGVSCSVETVEKLRKEYLTQLHQQMSTEILATKQYAFYEEPPTWTIIFDGKPIRKLQANGFSLLHYLVSRKGQKVSLFELAGHAGFSSDNAPADKEAITEFQNDDYAKDGEDHLVGLGRILDHRDGSPEIADDQYRHQAKQRISELEGDLSAAKKTNDNKKIEKLTFELDRLRKFYMELIKPGGGLQNFKNETDRIKDRIGKEITRAIDQLAKANEKAGKHFKEAFRKRYTFYHCYDPRENIKWSLD